MAMKSATVHTAAQTTGWSVRMLHYLDAAGLVTPARSASGYRLYGEREITQLRALRQLLADHELRPADLQVALRLRSEPALRHAVDHWLDATAGGGQSGGEGVPATNPNPPPTGSEPAISWLRFEQDKHSRALQTPRTSHADSHTTPTKETA